LDSCNSTKNQDILNLVGITYSPNGKFNWIELNGEEYGWTREGRNVCKDRIVMVEMGKIRLLLFGQVLELTMITRYSSQSGFLPNLSVISYK
jgi:hypothetical protein